MLRSLPSEWTLGLAAFAARRGTGDATLDLEPIRKSSLKDQNCGIVADFSPHPFKYLLSSS